jgi:uncharacterized phage protein (TIGR01671 family)
MNDRFRFRVWDDTHKEYLPLSDCKLDARNVEQCTGLKDKNGKLIFEGDVVIGSWDTKLIVFWDAISASYRVKPLDNCGGDRELHYYSNMDGISYYNFEIIGNIHEMEVEK